MPKEKINKMMKQMRNKNFQNAFANILEFAPIQPAPNYLEQILKEFPNLSLIGNSDLTHSLASNASQSEMSEISQGQLGSICDNQIDQLKQIYQKYTPVHEELSEIERLVQSMNAVPGDSSGKPYLIEVYKEYVHRGGKKGPQQMETKLMSDLLFLIRKENEKSSKYS